MSNRHRKPSRAPVAQVIAGDSWDDLRPARPVDFVGRDDVINEVAKLLEQVRTNQTQTRTIAIQAPSGWGKSSLILKLVDLARNGKRLAKASLTAVDSRSAANAAFVTEALRVALLEAQNRGLITKQNGLRIDSLNNPLESPDIKAALDEVAEKGACVVLIFDQFEELFAKEDLYETFNAVRELSMDIDSQQVPLVLGFAWKTDVSLPQQHPAYYMWHSLEDRRRSFRVRVFGSKDISKVITKAENSLDQKLLKVVRARLIEQCQGLPWLLKKLLVHILKRVDRVESQYALLERELDVELLFKEDLSSLTKDQIKCLKFVAPRAPVPVTDVEDNFSPEITNTLIHAHFLVRSGMNYVIYWDIFRDYLVDEKVPQIPWARTFQRGPKIAMLALFGIKEIGVTSASSLSKRLGITERSAINVISDLVALQLVNNVGEGAYQIAAHLQELDPYSVAQHVQGQMRRHVIVRELVENWEPDVPIRIESWNKLFSDSHPRTASFSHRTVQAYANTFREWLLFAGILERLQNTLVRSLSNGKQMGLFETSKITTGTFLGTASPDALTRVIKLLCDSGSAIARSTLEAAGLRNAASDAVILGLAIPAKGGLLRLVEPDLSVDDSLVQAKLSVLSQNTVGIVSEAIEAGITDITQIGQKISESIGASWKPTSARRYANGIRRYLQWAQGSGFRQRKAGS